MNSILEEHLYGIYKILQNKVGIINQTINHNTTKGTENEKAIKELLTSFLPNNFGIGDGIIVDPSGETSKQVDIIIYDKSQPNYFLMEDSKFFLADSVLLTIEIKTCYTTGNGSSLESGLENTKSIKKIRRSKKPFPIPSFIFFFTDDGKVKKTNVDILSFYKKLKEHIDSVPLKEQPNAIFSLHYSTMFLNQELSGTQKNQLYLLFPIVCKEDTKMPWLFKEPKLSKKHRFFYDFRQEGLGDGETIRLSPITDDSIDEFGTSYALPGTHKDPIIYKFARLKDKYFLLDEYRAFIAFIIYLIGTLLKISQPGYNFQSNFEEYFGKDYFTGQDIEQILDNMAKQAS